MASLGGLAALLVYLAVDIGHLRLRSQTGARGRLLLLAVAATAGTAIAFTTRMATDQPVALAIGAVVLAASFGAEAALRRTTGRAITGDRRAPADEGVSGR